MTNTEIIRKILNLSEITQSGCYYWIDRYKHNNFVIINQHSGDFIRTLIDIEILTFQSGNFETNERHYLLNDDFIIIKDKTRYIQFNKIEEYLKSYLTGRFNYKSIYFQEIQEIFNKIKIKEIRKQKIKRIEKWV